MATGEYVSLADIARALMARGITGSALQTSLAIVARETGLVNNPGGRVESDLPETPGSASTWLKGPYDPNAVGHGVFQFTPGQDYATKPMHPNMDGWPLDKQLDFFVQNYASHNDFSPWTYNPTYAWQVTSPDSKAIQVANATIQGASSAPPAASGPQPQGGNAPMPPPTPTLTPFQQHLAAGYEVDLSKTTGLYTGYAPDGTEVVFYPNGDAQIREEYGTPNRQQQDSAVFAAYRASPGGPDFGPFKGQVESRQTASGNTAIAIKAGAADQVPAATQSGPGSIPQAGGASANANASGVNDAGQAGGIGGGGPLNGRVNIPGIGNVNPFAQSSANAVPNQPLPTGAPGYGVGALSNTNGGTQSAGRAGTSDAPSPSTGAVAAGAAERPSTAAQQTTAQSGYNPPPPPVAAPVVPRPAALIQNPVIPPGPTGDYYRSIVQPQTENSGGGLPLYFGNAARAGNYPTIASASPGSVSVVSSQGGLGFNPLAIQGAQHGLGSFDIPIGPLTNAAQAAIQNNPYGADNPLERARLSGLLVKPENYTSTGSGATSLSIGQYSNPDYNQPAFPQGGVPVSGSTVVQHYATGGGLVIPEHAQVIGDSGRVYATITDSRNQRPETLYDHGGSISVLNHAATSLRPDDPNTGMLRRFASGGSFGDSGAATYEDTPVGGTASTGAADASASGTAGASGGLTSTPAIPNASFAPVTPSVTAQPVATPQSALPTIPQLPQAPVAPAATIDNWRNGVNEGQMPNPAMGLYQNQLGSYLANLDATNATTQADIASRNSAALSGLDSPESQALAQQVAARQRAQDSTDYKYGAAGLPKPLDLAPPLGQNGLNGGSLGPGLRWALLSPQQQYNMMNTRLGDISSTLAAQVNAAKALAAAQQAQYQAQLAAMGLGGTAGGSGSGKPSSGSGGLAAPTQSISNLLAGVGMSGNRSPQ